MILTYIRWADACYEEADGQALRDYRLAILHEVGFLIGENENSVSLAMEHQDQSVHPGRWRVHIPKVNILERKEVDFEKVFGLTTEKPKRQPKKKSPTPQVSVSSTPQTPSVSLPGDVD